MNTEHTGVGSELAGLDVQQLDIRKPLYQVATQHQIAQWDPVSQELKVKDLCILRAEIWLDYNCSAPTCD